MLYDVELPATYDVPVPLIARDHSEFFTATFFELTEPAGLLTRSRNRSCADLLPCCSG